MIMRPISFCTKHFEYNQLQIKFIPKSDGLRGLSCDLHLSLFSLTPCMCR